MVDDRTVEVTYIRSSGDGCGEAEGADVDYGQDVVTIGLLVDLSADVCPADAVPETYTVRLDEPLAGREVVDRHDG